MTTELIVNHLWQSSCFVLLAGFLALVLRKNRPKARYWIWLSASLKFLLPLALLVSLGGMFPKPVRRSAPATAPVAAPVFSNALVQIAEPFTPNSYVAVSAQAPTHWVPVIIGIPWAVGFLAIAFVRVRAWLRVRAALRASTPIDLPVPLPAFIAPGAEEPGVVGFLRPVLVLPARLLEHLNARQLEAVLAHELCHVRRRDNLFAAIHMLVEAIFWFHPLVWWIGSRMVEERELACDEEVLCLGCEPTDYAQGILKVCRFYTESPLPCVSGVTGADVKKRVRAILTGSIARELSAGKKLALAAIGAATLATPIAIGMLNAPQVRAQSEALPRPQPLVAQAAAPQGAPPQGARQVAAQPAATTSALKFESASIETAHRAVTPHVIDSRHFEYAGNVVWLMQWAYGVRKYQIWGGPVWLGEDPDLWRHREGVREEFEIQATAAQPSSEAEMKQMVQALLADRFKLKLHRETRELPIYALLAGPNGPNLVDAGTWPGKPPAQWPCEYAECGFPNVGGGSLIATDASMAGFASLLTNNMDRVVIDKTNLTGHYKFTLTYKQIEPDWRTGSAILEPIQTLGLKLEPQTQSFEVLVIDSVEHPSGN